MGHGCIIRKIEDYANGLDKTGIRRSYPKPCILFVRQMK